MYKIMMEMKGVNYINKSLQFVLQSRVFKSGDEKE